MSLSGTRGAGRGRARRQRTPRPRRGRGEASRAPARSRPPRRSGSARGRRRAGGRASAARPSSAPRSRGLPSLEEWHNSAEVRMRAFTDLLNDARFFSNVFRSFSRERTRNKTCSAMLPSPPPRCWVQRLFAPLHARRAQRLSAPPHTKSSCNGFRTQKTLQINWKFLQDRSLLFKSSNKI